MASCAPRLLTTGEPGLPKITAGCVASTRRYGAFFSSPTTASRASEGGTALDEPVATRVLPVMKTFSRPDASRQATGTERARARSSEPSSSL